MTKLLLGIGTKATSVNLFHDLLIACTIYFVARLIVGTSSASGQEYDAQRVLVSPPLERYREKFDSRHYPLQDVPSGQTVTRFNVDKTTWNKSRAAINRDLPEAEENFPTAKCFAAAFDFLALNADADNWFLQLECFDPHEPFVAPERFREAYASGYNGKILDWPIYERVAESEEEIAEIGGNYAALVAMCDEYFGKLLDYFDAHDLWQDTVLVLSTDHGFLLSEHDWWGKNRTTYFEKISHIPLMIAHPDFSKSGGERRASLTKTPDLMPTFLDVFGCEAPPSVTGTSLVPLLEWDAPVHDSIILGMFAGPVCITDGRYSYFRFPDDANADKLNLYTLMSAHMIEHFDVSELRTAQLAGPFDFTKGAPFVLQPVLGKVDWVYSDFKPLNAAVSNAFAIGGCPDESRWSNFEEMMEYGKANPGKLRYSSRSRNNLPHMVIAKVLQSYGVVAQNVPYSADGNAVKDLKSGVLDFSFVNVGNYIQDKEAFNIMLALSELPGVKASYDGAPSIVDLNIDLGLSGLAPMGWTWWIVHADTPDDVADRLREAMAAAMTRNDVRAAIEAVGFVPLEWDHAQYDEIIGAVSGQLSAMGNALAWEEKELKKLQ